MTWEVYLTIAIILIVVGIYLRSIWKEIRHNNEPAVAMLVTEQGLIECPKCKTSSFTIKDNKLMCYVCKTMYISYGPFGIEEYNKRNVNNPYGISDGDVAILDADMQNSSTVKVKRISPRGIYAHVNNGEESWEVMTNRLSLPVFYCTFGQAHVIRGVKLREHWVEIAAKNIEDAENYIRKFVGLTYSFVKKDIDKSFYPKGCIAQIIVPY